MKPEPDPISTDTAALKWARQTGIADEICSDVMIEVRRRQRRRATMVRMALFALVAGGTLWHFSRSHGPGRPATAVSAVVVVPEKRMLPDGSSVELKEGARIDTDFGERLRRVILQKGEAHFQVAKNSTRPFVVVAGRVEVRAVGTAFSVQRDLTTVDVLVTEGRVAVDQTGPSAEPAVLSQYGIMVDAGSRIIVKADTPVDAQPSAAAVAVSQAEVSDRLAWRIPRLRLSGTPLADAAPLFNQYSRVQLVLGDPEVGKLKLSGILRADNADSLIQLLEAEFGVVAEPRGDGEIVLRKGR